MIISASRRTDIPAFFADMFMAHLRQRWVDVANPFNRRQVSRVSLSPGDVDVIVFWTKNPAPFMGHLDEIDRMGFPYYFLFTVNDYSAHLEPAVPPLPDRLDTFRRLSDRLGPDRVIWRYDPIILSDRFTPSFHLQAFGRIAGSLRGKTNRVLVSVVDFYRKTERRIRSLEQVSGDRIMRTPLDHPDIRALVSGLAETAGANGMEVRSCAEDPRLQEMGIRPGKCIDDELIRRVFGLEVPPRKDKGQRENCRCVMSRDIGAVDTCRHGCVYCYATTMPGK